LSHPERNREGPPASQPQVQLVSEEIEASPALGAHARRDVAALLFSVLVVSLCAIIYQLQIGAISSYLLGNSVQQFSFTIGLFMFALGLGSWLSKYVRENLLERLLAIEIALALVGGLTSYLLFAFYAYGQSYYGAMIATTIAVGTLVGLEVPLLTRLARRYASLRVAISSVLTWDYVGALVGALLFPLVLLPNLGLLAAAPATGLLNAAVAVLLLAIFWRDLRRRRIFVLATLVAVAGLAAALGLSRAASGAIDRRLYLDEVMLVRQSPYQKIVVTRWNADIRLFLNGHLQFSSTDEHRYHEALVHPAMASTVSREAVLILGGGDGLAVREVLKYPEVKRVTLVDIDREVTDLARTYPPIVRQNRGALSDPRVHIVHEDAFSFLASAPADRFGVILSDLPDPTTESLAKLYSVELYRLVREHLAMGGVAAVQSTSPFFARKAYWAIEAALRAARLQTLPYHVYIPSFGDWGFHLAAHGPPRVPERLPVEARFLTPDVLRASLVFDGDITRVDVPVNSLQQPVLQGLYLAGWSRWTVP
jgi:spermidine synthase